MRYNFTEIPYNRQLAVEYANYWAYRRNPKFYAFDEIGGDCTNFVSQCLYAANGVMNFTPTYGWYYISVNDRAPAWTGVVYLYNFLTSNQGPGPFGVEVGLEGFGGLEPGDVVQMVLGGGPDYSHTVLVMKSGNTLDDILIASHDNNANCRQLSTYAFSEIRGIHIEGVRYIDRNAGQI